MKKKTKKKPKKRKVGRPTKYSKGILKKSERYIKSCTDEFKRTIIEETIKNKGNKKVKTRKIQAIKTRLVVKLPKAEGLALFLGVTRSTLYEWAKDHEEFSDILEKINQIQADRVINEALAGNYNPLIAKLLLGKHGYKDRSDITSDDKPIPILGNNFKKNEDKRTD